MKKIFKSARVPVLLAAAVIFTVVPFGQSASHATYAVHKTKYYDIVYFSTMEHIWAAGLEPYLTRAFLAAKTTIGYELRPSKLRIYFKRLPGGTSGWMRGGLQYIYLNRNIFTRSSYEQWGCTIAHETAHILFYNYTKATLWDSSLFYYRTFFTESLSHWAQYVYYRKKYNYWSAYREIRAKLRFYYGKTGYVMSWYDAGYYYKHGSGYMFYQAVWSLCGAGWYLTAGRLTSPAYYLKKCLAQMRSWSSRARWWLRSSNDDDAVCYFEYAFKFTYGRLANAGWYWTLAYKDTSYLYGNFWYYFYK